MKEGEPWDPRESEITKEKNEHAESVPEFSERGKQLKL